ncbi:MAG: 16S rRNA (adenine(1518)-N(6)/adenine(1519)-N(6))-dimethyltransferase RsmA [Acidilobaceae archaeon]
MLLKEEGARGIATTSLGLPSRRELIAWTLRILKNSGLKLVDYLGQHFLIDPRGVEYFINGLKIWSGSDMVEIGPGLGTITLYASRIASRILAIELDHRLANIVKSIVPDNVLVIVGDGVSFARAIKSEILYSNTPYNISGRLIAMIARNNNIKYSLLGVQLELAKRIIANRGSKDYGRLTLLVERYFNARIATLIPRSYYYPKPKVSGAIIELSRKREWRDGDEIFEDILRCLFSNRNKKAYKIALKCLDNNVESSLSWLKEKRVKDLSLDDIEKLVEIINKPMLHTKEQVAKL